MRKPLKTFHDACGAIVKLYGHPSGGMHVTIEDDFRFATGRVKKESDMFAGGRLEWAAVNGFRKIAMFVARPKDTACLLRRIADFIVAWEEEP